MLTKKLSYGCEKVILCKMLTRECETNTKRWKIIQRDVHGLEVLML